MDTQIPGTLIFKNLKINCSDEEYIANNNNDKNQECINQIISKNRSFIKSFQQQTLRGWYFTPTIKGSLLCTCFCWVTLLTLGIINLAVTSSLIEVKKSFKLKKKYQVASKEYI